jgi:hypothetical protein
MEVRNVSSGAVSDHVTPVFGTALAFVNIQ